ncbi:MAG: hypothetical protein SFV15_17465 [Polyangiaceae bacterium]|nr:hypothetical protein [Polyangiaceae bacterium]
MRPLPHSPDLTAELARRGLFFLEGPEYFQTLNAEFLPDPLLEELRKDIPLLAKFETDLGLLHINNEGTATLVRSCAGGVPLYYWQVRDVFAISSTLHQRVHCFPEEPANIDPLVCAMHASGVGVFPEGRTTVKGVRILEIGHLLKVSRRLHQPLMYWPIPRFEVSPMDPEAWLASAEMLKKTLLKKMDREMSSSGNNLVSFSGGVDSSCVVALAGALSKPTATISFITPHRGDQAEQQRQIQIGLAHAGIGQHLSEVLSNSLRARLAVQAPPLPQIQLHPVLNFLPRLVDLWGPVTLGGGEFADRLLGGRTQTIWDLARDSSLAGLRRYTTPRDFLGLSKARALWLVTPMGKFRGSPFPVRLRPWARNDLNNEYTAWLEQTIGRNDVLPRWHLRRRLMMNRAIPMNWEACSRLGVRRVYPFLCRTILDLALNSHPSDHFGVLPSGARSGPKRMLRRSLSEIVPREALYQADKPRPRHPHAPDPLPTEFFSAARSQAGELGDVIASEALATVWTAHFPEHDGLQVLGLLNIVNALRTRPLGST